jgi:FtsX-like permease family
VHSPLGMWRVSLERMRVDWPIVGAAWLITLLAATLLAAGPIYSSAVSLAGLHRVLSDAPVPSANVEITLRAQVADAPASNVTVTRALHETMGDLPTEVRWSGQSNTFALPGQDPDDVRDLAVLGFTDGIEEHASLVAGAWPAEAAGDEAIDVAVSEEAATEMRATVGDELELTSRLDSTMVVSVRVAGIYHVDDPTDPFWWEDQQLLAGVSISDRYRTIGPLLTTRANAFAHAGTGTVAFTWHAFPDFSALGVDETSALRARLRDLPSRLEADLQETTPRVATQLGPILARSERSLLVSRTGVLLLIIQLAVLAAYAIVLTANLLVEHRRVHTALLRSRGAGTAQIAGLALTEGLILAIPAAVLGPWLAVGALSLLNVAGPLASIQLGIVPMVSSDAYLAAGLAALGCVVLLVLPALTAARSFMAEQAGISRQETRTLGQRIGIDLALLAITVIALWQLRLYGSPLTTSVRGTLGLDPLLVAAPAIGLLAGGVLALRLLPLMAELIERAVARGRHLVGSMGARQLARRPLRYTRAALLLMLAISMGIFAVSYGSTWADSQQDQAAYQVGTDVRVEPGRGPSAIPPWAQAATFGTVDGVTSAMPVRRERLSVTRTAGVGTLLGLVPEAAGAVQFRPDQASAPLGDVLAPLAAQRPEADLIQLDGEPARLRVSAEIAITSLVRQTFDPNTGEAGLAPVPLSVLRGRPVFGASVVLRDADGLLHRFVAAAIPLNPDGPEQVEIEIRPPDTLAAGAEGLQLQMRGPVQIVEAALQISVPGLIFADEGTVELAALDWSEEAEGDAWQAVDLASAGGWVTTISPAGQAFPTTVPHDGNVIELTRRNPLLGSGFTIGQPNQVGYLASSVDRFADAELPAVVNRALLEGTSLAVGEVLGVRLFGRNRIVRITAAVESFPTSEANQPLVIADLPTLELMRFAAARQINLPDEWWLQTEDGRADGVAATFLAAPLTARSAESLDERTRVLSADPVALGIIGALSVGFVVAALFAMIGLAISAAVSARQRRTEFALLRALGLSGRELSGWLWLENTAVVTVSLAAGTVMGLVIGWVVLPFVTVTQAGENPFPPVLLEVPWGAILLLELLAIGALGVTVVILSRILRRFGIGSALRMGED